MTQPDNTSVAHDDDTYIVDVTYEDGLWVAVVKNLPGAATDAPTYQQLQDYTKDVIATLTGTQITDDDIVYKLPPGPIDLHDLAAEDQCAVHGYEPVPLGVFRICGECHHAYATEQELLDAHNEVLFQVQSQTRLVYQQPEEYPHVHKPAVSADQVWCCPLCTHDW